MCLDAFRSRAVITTSFARCACLSDYESAGVLQVCRCDVLHMEVKTLDVGGSFRYVVGSLLFVVLCCEQREFGVAGRAALVVEDGQDLTACYAIEPASVNISSCYRLWHVFSPLSEAGFTGFKDFQDCGTCDESHYYKLFVRLGVFLIGRFPSYKSFFISFATECFDFGDDVLDGGVARWGVRNVD